MNFSFARCIALFNIILICCDVCRFCGDFSRVGYSVSANRNAASVFLLFIFPIIAAESCICELAIVQDLM